jgi:hypothetical protein
MHASALNLLRVFSTAACTRDHGLGFGLPVFSHLTSVSAPHLAAHMIGSCVVSVGDRVMGTAQDHRKCAEECMAMAQAADDQKDKVLWLTLAQSWIRLAEHVTRVRSSELGAADSQDVFAVHSSD